MSSDPAPGCDNDPQSPGTRIVEQGGIRRDTVALWVAIISLVASITIGALSIYFPFFHKSHQLEMLVSGFSYDFREERLQLDLTFSNEGNQYELVLDAHFQFQLLDGGRAYGSYWVNRIDQITLRPLALGPGEVVHRRLIQPFPLDELLSMEKIASDSVSAFLVVELSVTVQGPLNLPRGHTIQLGEIYAGESRWMGVAPSTADSVYAGGVQRIDLFEGGQTGWFRGLVRQSYDVSQ